MSKIRCQISVSIDGFAAGPDQSHDHPLRVGGMRLHEWLFATDVWNARAGLEGGARTDDFAAAQDALAGVGAYVIGRNMLGQGRG